jgi:hypothetical protein
MFPFNISSNRITVGGNGNVYAGISGENYEIWSAPSTVKITRDDMDYENKGPAAINISAVKNEYESSQLLITSEVDIGSFYLTTSDLSDGNGHTINKSNITVYYEKYVPAVNETEYESGWYPDALIPIENANNAGELTVKAGNNAAFWITFYIPAETATGTYTANFTLKVENNTHTVPVSVKVYDYTLTDDINHKSCLNLRPMYLACGELDNSVEMREKYYEFFLDYRLALRSLPIETATVEEKIASAKKYFNQTPCYFINTNEILAFAEASTPEMNLLSKAYLNIYDESYMWLETNAQYFRNTVTGLKAIKKTLNSYVTQIQSDTTGKYDSFKQIDGWENYIRNISNIIADHFDRMIINGDQNDEDIKEYLSLFNTYCTLWNTYDDSTRNVYLGLLEENGADAWWYGCLAPTSPYGNYHIADKNLLSARSISWLQQKYGIEGTMYWDTAGYATETSGENGVGVNILSINIYDNLYKIGGSGYSTFPAGDGHLVYPGAAYNVYGPLPSMRLMSIRDGMEEYEMLFDLENNFTDVVNSYSTTYGEEIDVKVLMEQFYNKVYYNGAMLYADGKGGLNFSKLRTELLEALSDVDDPSNFLMYSDILLSESKAIITLYANDDYGLKVNGNTLSPQPGSSVKYVYELNLLEETSVDIEVKNKVTGKTCNYNRFVSLPVLILNDFDLYSSVPEGITVTDNSLAEINVDSEFAYSGKSLKFTINSKFTGNPYLDAIFTPSFNISVSEFKQPVDFTSVSTLNLFIYNPGDEYRIAIKLYSGFSNVSCGNYVISPGVNNVAVSISNVQFSKLANVDKIAFEFVNGGNASNPKQYIAYIDNMYAVME